MEKGQKILISTIYLPEVVKVATYKLSPDLLILLDSRQKDDRKEYEIITKAIEDVEKSLKGFPVEIRKEKVPELYDLKSIAEKVINIIDKEYKEETQILVHITGGRKTLGFAVHAACMARKNKIKGLYYFIKENNKALKLPILQLQPGETKQKLLELIKQEITDIKTLEDKLGITKALVYSHIKDLRESGYIEDDEISLTDIGKIAIM